MWICPFSKQPATTADHYLRFTRIEAVKLIIVVASSPSIALKSGFVWALGRLAAARGVRVLALTATVPLSGEAIRLSWSRWSPCRKALQKRFGGACRFTR
jgi:hypothetical protein